MTGHTTTSHLYLDGENIFKALCEVIDSAVEMDRKLQGSTGLSIHLERIKHLADKYREAAY